MPYKVRVLTLTQPFASLMAAGEKCVETRSWHTQQRGVVAIHAAMTFPREAKDLCSTREFSEALHRMGYYSLRDLPLGKVVAMGVLTDCRSTTLLREVLSQKELAFGNYGRGRYGFIFERLHPLQNFIPVKGALGFWRWDIPEYSAAEDLYMLLCGKEPRRKEG